MDTKRKFIPILAVLACTFGLTSCHYNELPPKTGDAAKNYIKPKGEVPTAEERAEVDAARAEYEAATGQ